MKIRVGSLRVLILLIIVSCITGCGGDSQSNDTRKGDPPLYTGIADAASITANNAQTLTTGALNGADATITFQATSSSSATIASIKGTLVDQNLIKTLSAFNKAGQNYNNSKAIKAASSTTKTYQTSAVSTVSGSIPGECGGEVSYTLTVNDQSGVFSGNFSFNNYCEGGIVINGSTAVDGIYAIPTDEFETLNMKLTNLESGDYIILAGDVSLDYRNSPPTILISADLFTRKSSTGKTYWVNDYALNMLDIGTGVQINLSGRYYDPDYGYVDVSTPVPLTIDLYAEWPRSGELLCLGENSAAILTVLDDTSYMVDADRNGDGVYEYNIGPFFWSDL